MRRAGLLLLGLWCLASSPVAADTTIGNVAVVETDPTILQPGELFDLNGKTLAFTPKGGGYVLSVGGLSFNSSLGTRLSLGDEGSVTQPLGFTFPFFGMNYTSAFINANGYITFGAASTFTHFNGQSGGTVSNLGDASTVLDRMAGGLPRIAPLWQDWNPSQGGVFANSLADRLVVTWNGVPLFGSSTTATFQVVLFSSGVIQMSYQSVTTTPGGGYLVGVSPGGVGSFETTTLDLSLGAGGSISGFPSFEPLVQVFGTSSSPLVQISAVARRFYLTHGDQFDQLVMFTNFANALGNAFAFELNVQNTISGINMPVFSEASFWGSQGRLQSYLNMNLLNCYPADPSQTITSGPCGGVGTNSTLDVMGQEAGHAWLAYVQFDDSGVCSNLLLGRDLAHWSFFHDTQASDMEGNAWRDNGTGTFTTTEATARYSALDQYILGLRPASDVPSFFFIRNPTMAGGRTASSPPEIGVTVSGTRANVGVNQIRTCEGPRSPASGFSGINPTTTWKQAFILLTRAGAPPPSSDVGKVDTIRTAWVSYFNQATGGRGAIDTTMAISPAVVAAVLPSSRSVQVGTAATAFATILNAGPGLASGCTLAPVTSIPATFSFQATDPATNQVTGSPNAPVDIAASAAQSFVFAFTPTAPILPTDVQLSFDCVNTDPAPITPGLNTLLLSASTTPTPDIVALAATPTNDGIVNIPGATGIGVFSVATVNVGSGGSLTASADTGGQGLPVSLSICQTNPVTGVCQGAPAGSVTTTINAGATPTFGVFVAGTDGVPFAPATNRIFVRFRDGGGVVRGATSVAVRTQ